MPSRLAEQHLRGARRVESSGQEIRKAGEVKDAAGSRIGSAVIGKVAAFSTEFEGMPASNVRQIVDDLMRPVRALDLWKRVATAGRAEGIDGNDRKAAIGRRTRADERKRIRIHVGQVGVIRLSDFVAVAGIAELVFPIEAAAKFVDDFRTWQRRPVQSHNHRFRVCKRRPVLLRGRIILWSQAVVIADEVFARNRVLFIQLVINFDQSVMKRGVADRRSGVSDCIPVLKHSAICWVLGAISRPVIDETCHLQAQVFGRRRTGQGIAGVQHALSRIAQGGSRRQSQG